MRKVTLTITEVRTVRTYVRGEAIIYLPDDAPESDEVCIPDEAIIQYAKQLDALGDLTIRNRKPIDKMDEEESVEVAIILSEII